MPSPDTLRWNAIEQLLDAALDRPTAEREDYVRAHAADAQTAGFVLDLLARDARIGDFLEDAAVSQRGIHAADRFGDDATPPAPGQQIGAWRLLREIGSGGMAVVWLAERADGAYSQQVALKLVRPGLEGTLLRERFARERKILALLQHPRVARLIDGGIADGRPYLVLDHVDGLPITAWCARQRTPVRQRIALIVQVCAAVAFAHARLIIHRDLKPSNILVDARGDAHLLDFGIATILAGDHSEPTALTAIGGRAMTMAYAAPEQIEQRPLGVATDVYALGVVLYELLAGRLPYRAPRASLAAIEDAVLHEEPRLASSAADAAHAAQCGVSQRRLRRELHGDLDRILAKTLEKDPDRRYASVEALADDLDRHVRGLPVRAQRHSLRYRLGKFVRRHAFGLAVAGALCLAIAGGIAGTLWQARRAADSAGEARAEAAAASAVRDLLLDMFRTADPDVSRGRDPSASELLDAAARRLQAGFDDQPPLKAHLLGVVADLNRKLGHYPRAAELFGQAADVPAMAQTGNVAERWRLRTGRAASLMLAGDLDTAASEFDRIGNELADAGPSPQVAGARARMQIERGELLRRKGRFDEARAALDEALAYYAERPDDADSQEAALRHSAELEFSRGRLEEAERGFGDLVVRLRTRHGEDHTEVARALNDLAAVLAQVGHLDQAEQEMRRALDLRRRLLGAQHPAVADSYWNLGAILRRQERFEDAESHYRSALAIFRDSLGDDSVEVARVYNGLGALAGARRDHAASEAFLREALRRFEKTLGPMHPDVGLTLNNIAVAQRRLGRVDESIASAQRALAIQTATLPDDHFLVAVTRFTLGSLALMQDDSAEAVKWLAPAAHAMEGAMGAAHPDVVRAKLQWAVALALQGDVATADGIADAIVVPPRDHRIEADAAYLRGRIRLLAGRLAEACADLERGWRLRGELDGTQDPSALESEFYLGQCLLQSGGKDGRQHVLHAARALLDSPITAQALRGEASRALQHTATR
jgi:serine/threonine-protein kinase